VIFCPSYTTSEHGFWRVRYSCHARAIENQIYAVHSANFGDIGIPELKAYGSSAIICPGQEPLPPNGLIIEGRINEKEVVRGEIDLSIFEDIRKSRIVTSYNDMLSKIDLYVKWYSELKI